MKKTILEQIWLRHLLLLAFAVRIGFAGVANDIIDIQNFWKVAEIVSNQGIFALYSLTPGKYPYPPVWLGFELTSYWLDTKVGLPFSITIRLPSILADMGIVYLCYRWWQPVRSSRAIWAGLFYALNPVSLIITGLHGQFDALPTFFLISALWFYRAERLALSALALGIAIAFKPYPVLVLPLLLWHLPSLRRKSLFAVLSASPVVVLLIPFLLHSPEAIAKELFGYQGVALLGFMVPARAVYVPLTGDHFPLALTYRALAASKWLFFLAYVLWSVLAIRQRRSLIQWTVGVILLFYSLYAGISPQYLLWSLPLVLLQPNHPIECASMYTATGVLALVGFYAYAVPATIQPIVPVILVNPQRLYAIGGTLWWLSVLALIVWMLRTPTDDNTPPGGSA